MTNALPELLAPAGSSAALDAALSSGADAVYLGGTRFNARMSAPNFDAGALGEAVSHAHHLGGRVYLTLNTLVWDRELTDALAAAYEAAEAGVDGLIIADLGAAALIRRALPSLPLHASTQLSGHNAAVGQVLSGLGFTRFVIARETRFCDLAAAVRDNPLEVEVFVHGALCVSHSGQCLFSSVVGGRSGNRGECAQPCRLPYTCGNCQSHRAPNDRRAGRSSQTSAHGGRATDRRPAQDAYPLSLKDLSLAAHVPTLLDAGVASLKIEGRMKSPGYVGGVVAIWRRLLDERRGATDDEMRTLMDLFSRDGFTDAYQTGTLEREDRGHHHMMGVRSDTDKERSAAAERAALALRPIPRLPVDITLTVTPNHPARLELDAPLYRQGNTVTVTVAVNGDIPAEVAPNGTPLTDETAARQLTRIGGTPYTVNTCTTRLPKAVSLSLPVSRLNALRRNALAALDAARAAAWPDPTAGASSLTPAALLREWTMAQANLAPALSRPLRTARFHDPRGITKAAADNFDILYLPSHVPHPAFVPTSKRGLLLPPVIFDREAAAARRVVETALQNGIRHVLVSNIGHLPLVREVAARLDVSDRLYIHGDFRLNAANAPAALTLLDLHLDSLLAAPELTLPRLRDMAVTCPDGTVGAIVYGRLPLMLLEKCAIREAYASLPPSTVCRDICAADRAVLRDRMGKDFPLLRERGADRNAHRTLVVNSLPLSMSDRWNEIARLSLGEHHFIFTVESPAEVDRVIHAYRTGTPVGGEVRRMK